MLGKAKKVNRAPGIPAGTRKRILDAAGELFSASGYGNATIREICRRAGVNIAAVNYHFKDKENLYLEVLKYWQGITSRKYPLDFGAADEDRPEERLRIFIRSLVLRTLGEGPVSVFGRLMAREYIEPTSALDTVVEDMIRPVFLVLCGIVRRLIGRRAREETVRLCSASVVGQCLYFLYAAPVIRRLFQQPRFDSREIEVIAAHITRFSVHAIRSFGDKDGGEKR